MILYLIKLFQPVGASGADGPIAPPRVGQPQELVRRKTERNFFLSFFSMILFINKTKELNLALVVAIKRRSILTTVLVTRPSLSTRVHGADQLAQITTRLATS